jgi:hypothetical protein
MPSKSIQDKVGLARSLARMAYEEGVRLIELEGVRIEMAVVSDPRARAERGPTAPKPPGQQDPQPPTGATRDWMDAHGSAVPIFKKARPG